MKLHFHLLAILLVTYFFIFSFYLFTFSLIGVGNAKLTSCHPKQVHTSIGDSYYTSLYNFQNSDSNVNNNTFNIIFHTEVSIFSIIILINIIRMSVSQVMFNSILAQMIM